MKYTFEQKELTCVSLEAELGLTRGDIVSITTYPEGAVEVETKETISSTVETKLKEALNKRNLPRGKMPEVAKR